MRGVERHSNLSFGRCFVHVAWRSWALAGLLLAISGTFGVPSADAFTSACSASYLGGEMPDFSRLTQAAPARELCFRKFAVLHSGATRTPIWVGEHLTAVQVAAAEAMSRTDRFHAERSLPKRERSELSDYRKSGFDRGHMAPSGNMPDAASQGESFSLANMVPQNRRLNTGTWSRIEETVRDVAALDGEVWVETRPTAFGRPLPLPRSA